MSNKLKSESDFMSFEYFATETDEKPEILWHILTNRLENKISWFCLT